MLDAQGWPANSDSTKQNSRTTGYFKKIGVITFITPWDGTMSIITCDMDQVLYNAYFAQIRITDPKKFIMF